MKEAVSEYEEGVVGPAYENEEDSEALYRTRII